VAERQFRRLRSPHLLEDVAAGVKYVDGIEVSRSTERVAA
jgi:hypothetical protein